MLSDRWGDVSQETAKKLEMVTIREERDRLLKQTDWTQLADIPEETKLLWVEYRQTLRDIPQNYTSLDDIVWPQPPVS